MLCAPCPCPSKAWVQTGAARARIETGRGRAKDRTGAGKGRGKTGVGRGRTRGKTGRDMTELGKGRTGQDRGWIGLNRITAAAPILLGCLPTKQTQQGRRGVVSWRSNPGSCPICLGYALLAPSDYTQAGVHRQNETL